MDVSELVEAEQIQASVAGHEARQAPLSAASTSSLTSCGGDVADPAAAFAGRQPQPYERVGLAGAGVAEQHDRLAGVHVVPAGELSQDGGRDGGHGINVEVRQTFQSRELGAVDAPGPAPFGAVHAMTIGELTDRHLIEPLVSWIRSNNSTRDRIWLTSPDDRRGRSERGWGQYW